MTANDDPDGAKIQVGMTAFHPLLAFVLIATPTTSAFLLPDPCNVVWRTTSKSRRRAHGNVANEPKTDVDVQPEKLEGESEDTRIERLGRQRPEKLNSIRKEAGFVFSITMSQLLTEYFISGFMVVIPTVVRELDIPPAATTWPAGAFSSSCRLS